MLCPVQALLMPQRMSCSVRRLVSGIGSCGLLAGACFCWSWLGSTKLADSETLRRYQKVRALSADVVADSVNRDSSSRSCRARLIPQARLAVDLGPHMRAYKFIAAALLDAEQSVVGVVQRLRTTRSHSWL